MKKTAAALLCIALAAAALSLFSASPHKAITKRLARLAGYGIFEGEAHPIESLAKGKEAAAFFTNPCDIEIALTTGRRTHRVSRSEIAERYAAMRRYLGQLATSVGGISVKTSGDHARASAVVTVMGRESGRDDYFMERHTVEFEFQRAEGTWLISSLRNLDPIESGEGPQ